MLTIISMEEYRVEESLGFLANRLATAMRRSLEEKLKEYDLTAPQFGFMAILFEEDGQPLSNIGRCIYCDKPTITGIANRLEKKGLINKIRDDKDRRVVKAVLTKKGKGFKDVLYKMAMEVNTGAAKGFPAEEVKLLKAQLRRSLDNVLGTIEGGVINV